MKHYRYNITSNVLENCEASSCGRVVYTTIETFGNDLDDLLANAYVGREDWNGNERPQLHISDLSEAHYGDVERDLIEAMISADESAYEAMIDGLERDNG